MQAAAGLAARGCPAFVTTTGARGVPVTYKTLATASSAATGSSPPEQAMQSLVSALAARYDEGGSLIAPDVQSHVPCPATSHRLTVEPVRLAAALAAFFGNDGALPGTVPDTTPPPRLDHIVCFVTHRAAGLSETVECEYIVPWVCFESGGRVARLEERRIVVAFVDDNGGGEYLPVTMSIDDGPRVALPRDFRHPCIHGSRWVDHDAPRWLPTRVVVFTAPFVHFRGHLSELRSWFRRLPRVVSPVDDEIDEADMPMADALILFFRGSFVINHGSIGGPVFSHIAHARKRIVVVEQEEERRPAEQVPDQEPEEAPARTDVWWCCACCACVFIIAGVMAAKALLTAAGAGGAASR